MFFAFILAVIGTIKKKTIHNIIYIIGFTILLATVIKDSVYFSLKLTPFAWLIPNGYTIFITFIFFILASEQVNIYKLSVNRALELQKIKDNLEIMVKDRTLEIEQQKEEIGTQRDNLQDLNSNLNQTIAELNQKNIEVEQQKEEIISQRDNLKDLNNNLSLINNQLNQKNDEITQQKEEIEIRNKNITASINYAKRIQNAVLPSIKILDDFFSENFIIYIPKNIVSGDFYFIRKINNILIIAAGDCTGHGVPGAFMSMLGITLLNEIVPKKEITTASEALNVLREHLKSSLQHKGLRIEQKDGIDIALCALNTETLEMNFAGAQNPLVLVKNINDQNATEFVIIKGDKMPIGAHPREHEMFTNHVVQLGIGDVFYIFSDGFESQFGGLNNEKFKALRFHQLLHNLCIFPLSQQKIKIENTFSDWKGNKTQVDDILIIGLKL
jgi:serine phosphatase RsbU (regulator of sigma subunit)